MATFRRNSDRDLKILESLHLPASLRDRVDAAVKMGIIPGSWRGVKMEIGCGDQWLPHAIVRFRRLGYDIPKHSEVLS